MQRVGQKQSLAGERGVGRRLDISSMAAGGTWHGGVGDLGLGRALAALQGVKEPVGLLQGRLQPRQQRCRDAGRCGRVHSLHARGLRDVLRSLHGWL